MTRYVHELPGWPDLRWRAEEIARPLGEVRLRQGRLLGQMHALGFAVQVEGELPAAGGGPADASPLPGPPAPDVPRDTKRSVG